MRTKRLTVAAAWLNGKEKAQPVRSTLCSCARLAIFRDCRTICTPPLNCQETIGGLLSSGTVGDGLQSCMCCSVAAPVANELKHLVKLKI